MTTGIVKMVLSVIAISSLGFASAAAQSAADLVAMTSAMLDAERVVPDSKP